MKIKTRLQINTFLFVFVSFLVGLVLFWASTQIDLEIRQGRVINEVVKGMSVLGNLVHEYSLYHTDRARTQWEAKHESLSRLLTVIEIKSPEQKAIVINMQRNHENVKSIFDQLTLLHEKKEGLDQEHIALYQEFEHRLSGQLAMNSEGIIFGSLQLSQTSQAGIMKAQNRSVWLIIIFIMILATSIGAVSFFLNRSIVKPIIKLKEATKYLGIGNLDFKVEISSKDELGDLSVAFNKMLESLKATTVSRDKLAMEITERKQIEKALKKSEGQVRLLLNSTGEAIYGLDLEGNCTFVNPACLRMLGYEDSNQLLEKNMHNLIHHTRKDGTPYPEEECKIYLVFRQGSGTHVDDEVLWRANGTSFPAEYWSHPIYWDNKVIGSVVTFLDITERNEAEKQIKNSLKEKEVLLQEIHHRVKNNMQIISSLLLLQSKYIKDEQDLELFNESRNQIKSMSLIHEKLYQSKDMVNIDFNDYIKDLANEMLKFYRVDVNKIALKIDVEDIYFSINIALPLGLVINELLSNCLKYAFPFDSAQGMPGGRKDEIRISMRKIPDLGLWIAGGPKIQNPPSEIVELIVSDNGIGFPDNVDIRNIRSLGLQLVTDLVEDQLGGKVEINKNKGTEFRIRFKELKRKKKN